MAEGMDPGVAFLFGFAEGPAERPVIYRCGHCEMVAVGTSRSRFPTAHRCPDPMPLEAARSLRNSAAIVSQRTFAAARLALIADGGWD